MSGSMKDALDLIESIRHISKDEREEFALDKDETLEEVVSIAEGLAQELKMLVATVESHELYAYDCNRSGKPSCDCIELALQNAKKHLSI